MFVTMGEERSSLFLVQRLRDYLGVNALAPEENALVGIEFYGSSLKNLHTKCGGFSKCQVLSAECYLTWSTIRWNA